VSLDAFLEKFHKEETFDTEQNMAYCMADAPNALATFMSKFSPNMESIWFYEGKCEIRFDKESHRYYRVEELGNLTLLRGVTNVVHIIDRSMALMPWAAKKVAEKMIRLVATETRDGQIYLVPMTLAYFTQLVMEAKKAPNEEKEEAGDIGHMAHACLEDSIRHALDHTEDHIVRELKNLPTDEKAATAANSAFNWMKAHNVRWIETEGKIYSKQYGYAGTMDGLAYVDSCTDRTCCRSSFTNHLSLIDWKSSNYLYIEFLFQTASYQHAKQEESGIKIEDRWVLRLGKNEDEAGKFEPWYMGPEDFQQDLDGFLACLRLVELVDSVTDRMKNQKALIKGVKKEVRETQKAIEKAEEKLEKARAKAFKKTQREAEKELANKKAEEDKNALRIARAAEKARVKEEARALRETVKQTNAVASKTIPEPKPVEIPAIVSARPKSGWAEFEEETVVKPRVFTIPEED
jgi:hypothetical protein